jgi:DNA-binding transcriptional LysR family regulator
MARLNSAIMMTTRATPEHTIIALAAEGHGVAVVPSTVVVRDGRVRGAPLTQQGSAIGRWLTVGWDRQRFLARYAEYFVKELVAACQRAHPGREFIRHALPPPRPKASNLSLR